MTLTISTDTNKVTPMNTPQSPVATLQADPHVQNLRYSYELKGDGTQQTILTVETDLSLDALDPAYDVQSVQGLVAACQGFLGSVDSVIDVLRIQRA